MIRWLIDRFRFHRPYYAVCNECMTVWRCKTRVEAQYRSYNHAISAGHACDIIHGRQAVWGSSQGRL